MASLHYQHIKDNRIENVTADEYLALLTDHQWEERLNNKIERLIRQAGFREQASVADVEYNQQRNLDKNMFTRLATLDFIKRKENIIITGASGTGKSYLAQALGYQACLMEYKVLYVNTAKLIGRLKLSKIDGSYLKELSKLIKTDILILDDFGLKHLQVKLVYMLPTSLNMKGIFLYHRWKLPRKWLMRWICR